MYGKDSRSVSPFGSRVSPTWLSNKHLIRPESKTNMFLSDNERFDKEFWKVDKVQREHERQRKDRAMSIRRENHYERERARQDQELARDYKDQLKVKNKFINLMEKGKRNVKAAYNPVTLEYDNTALGSQLKKLDDYKNYRAGLRHYNLDVRINSGYNILTGHPRMPPRVPPKPLIS